MSKTADCLLEIETDKRFPKFYMKRSNSSNAIGGVGIKAFHEELPKEACFGIWPFSQKGGLPWEGIQTKALVTPERWIEGNSSFALGPDGLPKVVQIEDLPEKGRWLKHCNSVLPKLEGGKKVVLGRLRRYFFADVPSPFALFRRMARKNPDCYGTLYMPQPGVSFLSVTPERLFCREGDRVETEALAGTRPIDADPKLFLASEKDRREHFYVKEGIVDALETLCVEVEASSTRVKAFQRWQHLHTEIQGRLQSRISDEMLIQALHPTPAVAGYPKDFALEEISEVEAWSRGAFAGIFGVFSKERAECVVSIRSCLLRGRVLYAFVGVGLVEGSDPEHEWQEGELKLSGLEEVLYGVKPQLV